mmetsp:Transcript_63477/g.146048  ORF Transcript_63477/g.146048 Transcript_63477/m.146048 type:complete len:204 (-) Transcript_63477:562-1173(-)
MGAGYWAGGEQEGDAGEEPEHQQNGGKGGDRRRGSKGGFSGDPAAAVHQVDVGAGMDPVFPPVPPRTPLFFALAIPLPADEGPGIHRTYRNGGAGGQPAPGGTGRGLRAVRRPATSHRPGGGRLFFHPHAGEHVFGVCDLRSGGVVDSAGCGAAVFCVAAESQAERRSADVGKLAQQDDSGWCALLLLGCVLRAGDCDRLVLG